MKATLLLLVSPSTGLSALAQDITGRWEAEEVSLEITRILKSGILESKQPRHATRPARNRLTVEFLADGTFRMGAEGGTYRQQGKKYSITLSRTTCWTVERTSQQGTGHSWGYETAKPTG